MVPADDSGYLEPNRLTATSSTDKRDDNTSLLLLSLRLVEEDAVHPTTIVISQRHASLFRDDEASKRERMRGDVLDHDSPRFNRSSSCSPNAKGESRERGRGEDGQHVKLRWKVVERSVRRGLPRDSLRRSVTETKQGQLLKRFDVRALQRRESSQVAAEGARLCEERAKATEVHEGGELRVREERRDVPRERERGVRERESKRE
jgi:hypothetical protein